MSGAQIVRVGATEAQAMRALNAEVKGYRDPWHWREGPVVVEVTPEDGYWGWVLEEWQRSHSSTPKVIWLAYGNWHT